MQSAQCDTKKGRLVKRSHVEKMVPRGLEPRTFRLLAERSDQLSYETRGSKANIKDLTNHSTRGPRAHWVCPGTRPCAPEHKKSQSTSPLLSVVLAPYEWRHLLPAARLLAPAADAASADANRACSRGRKIPMTDMTLAGLEPAIFGSEDQRLIH